MTRRGARPAPIVKADANGRSIAVVRMKFGKLIDPAARYRVALPEFLLTGGEVNMGFLKRGHPQLHDVEGLRDIRRALMDELRAVHH